MRHQTAGAQVLLLQLVLPRVGQKPALLRRQSAGAMHRTLPMIRRQQNNCTLLTDGAAQVGRAALLRALVVNGLVVGDAVGAGKAPAEGIATLCDGANAEVTLRLPRVLDGDVPSGAANAVAESLVSGREGRGLLGGYISHVVEYW